MMRCRWSYLLPLLSLFICHTAFAQWVESNNGIYGGAITSLANHNGHIFAGTMGGVYHSIDNAVSWKQFNVGLDNTFVNSIVFSGNGNAYVAAEGEGRVFVSSAPFSSWTSASAGLPTNTVTSLAVINNQLFGITRNGLLYTLEEGNTMWTRINSDPGHVNSISAFNENLFAATDDGIYLSSDRGLNWRAMNNGLIEKSIYSISTVNNYVIAKARAGVTFFSNDTGSSWSLATPAGDRFKLIELNDILYAGSEFEVYFSTNKGKTWETVRTLPGATDFILNGATIIAGNPFGIYKSINTFQWTASNYNSLTNAKIAGFAASQNDVFCATGRGEVLRSGNLGKSWTSISRGLPLNQITAIGYFDNTLLVALSNYGIYRSANDGGSWSLVAGIARLNSFVKHKNHLFAGGGSGVYRSTDNGRTWSRLINSPQSVHTLKLLDQSDTLFASSPDYGVSFSADNGQSWTYINDGLPLPSAKPAPLETFQGLTLVGVGNLAPVFIRETISSPWQSVSEGFIDATLTSSFATDGRNLFAAGNGGVFISGTGFDWSSFYNEQLPPLNSPLGVESLIVHRNHLFAGTEAYGVWVSCINPPRPIISKIGNAPNDSTLVSDSPDGNQWFLNDLPITGATQATYKPSATGKYSVMVKLNDCESERSEQVDLFLEEYPDAVIIMPNVFTPDGDAYNPVFVPQQFDDVSAAEIQIVDRWGQEIFRSTDLATGWDGGNTHAGVYYFHIWYIGKNGKSGQVNGWVHLIR